MKFISKRRIQYVMNKLNLENQISKYLKTDSGKLPLPFLSLLEAISKAYDQLENDHRKVEIPMSALSTRQNDIDEELQKNV